MYREWQKNTGYSLRHWIKGKLSERLKILERFNNGDYSIIENELNSLGTMEYDLILIGMPTHGNFPPKGFNEIIQRLINKSDAVKR